MNDAYHALGLEPGATPKDVKAAYRRLAKTFHPDVSQDPDAHDRFLAIQLAYETLLLVTPIANDRDARRRAHDDEIRRKAEAMMRESRVAPSSDPIGVERLLGLANTGRLAEAEKEARNMLQSDPRQVVPNAVLADLARMRGDTKNAVHHYGIAAQYSPDDPTYQKKLEETLRGHSPEARTAGTPTIDRSEMPTASLVLVGFAALGGALIRVTPPGLPVMASLGWAHLGVLVGTGFLVGVVERGAGRLERLGDAMGSSRVAVHPLTLSALLGIVQFWLGLVVYFFWTQTQNMSHASAVRAFGWAAALTIALALGRWTSSDAGALQALLIGGSAAWVGLLGGWALGRVR